MDSIFLRTGSCPRIAFWQKSRPMSGAAIRPAEQRRQDLPRSVQPESGFIDVGNWGMYRSMRQSIVQLARPRSADDDLAEVLGGDAERFFVLAHRVLWGVDQADMVRVDVDKTLRTLLDHYPLQPVAHLLAAFAHRERDRAAADRALERARAVCTEDHAHAYLLPTAAEWSGHKPPLQLETLVADRVWRVCSYDSVTGSGLASVNSATLVRVADGSLVIINPVPLDDRIRGEIAGLGEVSAIVVQGKAHSRAVEPTRLLFPGAKTFGTRGHGQHPPSAHLVFDHLLDDSSPCPKELTTIVVHGSTLDEVLLLHEPTRLLITQDLFQANQRSPHQPFSGRLYTFGFGIRDQVGMLAYQLFLIRDLARFQASFDVLARLSPTGIVGAHFGYLVEDAMGGFSATVQWIQSLGVMEHRLMLARYFSKQPGFLRDFMRYMAMEKFARSSLKPA